MRKRIVACVMLLTMVIALLPVVALADDIVAKPITFDIKDIRAEAGDEITIPVYVVGHSGVAGVSIKMSCSQFSVVDIVDGDWIHNNKVITMDNTDKGIFDWVNLTNIDTEEQSGVFAAYTVKISEKAKPGKYIIELTSSDIIVTRYDGNSKTYEGETITAYLTVVPSSEPTITVKRVYEQHDVGELILAAETIPADLEVTWESSDTSVAEIENGKVTVKGLGDAVISAKVTYNGREYSGTYELSMRRGDLNMDGEITNADTVLIARYLVKLAVLNDLQQEFADTNGDGKVNNADLVLIARSVVGD